MMRKRLSASGHSSTQAFSPNFDSHRIPSLNLQKPPLPHGVFSGTGMFIFTPELEGDKTPRTLQVLRQNYVDLQRIFSDVTRLEAMTTKSSDPNPRRKEGGLFSKTTFDFTGFSFQGLSLTKDVLSKIFQIAKPPINFPQLHGATLVGDDAHKVYEKEFPFKKLSQAGYSQEYADSSRVSLFQTGLLPDLELELGDIVSRLASDPHRRLTHYESNMLNAFPTQFNQALSRYVDGLDKPTAIAQIESIFKAAQGKPFVGVTSVYTAALFAKYPETYSQELDKRITTLSSTPKLIQEDIQAILRQGFPNNQRPIYGEKLANAFTMQFRAVLMEMWKNIEPIHFKPGYTPAVVPKATVIGEIDKLLSLEKGYGIPVVTANQGDSDALINLIQRGENSGHPKLQQNWSKTLEKILQTVGKTTLKAPSFEEATVKRPVLDQPISTGHALLHHEELRPYEKVLEHFSGLLGKAEALNIRCEEYVFSPVRQGDVVSLDKVTCAEIHLPGLKPNRIGTIGIPSQIVSSISQFRIPMDAKMGEYPQLTKRGENYYLMIPLDNLKAYQQGLDRLPK